LKRNILGQLKWYRNAKETENHDAVTGLFLFVPLIFHELSYQPLQNWQGDGFDYQRENLYLHNPMIMSYEY
jgi:hypothetical protein